MRPITRVRTISASRSISASGCSAVKAKRSRAVPGGTVGGRIATTRKPSASSISDAASAASVSPTIDRHDGALRFRQIERAGEKPRLAQRRVGQVRLALDQVERGDGGGNDRRRQAGRIDEGAGRGCASGRSPRARRTNSRHRRRPLSTACPSAAARRRRHWRRSSRGRPPTTPRPWASSDQQPGVVALRAEPTALRAARDRRPWKTRRRWRSARGRGRRGALPEVPRRGPRRRGDSAARSRR